MIAEVEIKGYTANETVLIMDIYPKLRAEVHSTTLEVTAFGTSRAITISRPWRRALRNEAK